MYKETLKVIFELNAAQTQIVTLYFVEQLVLPECMHSHRIGFRR